MKKNVLILGCGKDQMIMLQKAIELGIGVYALDERKEAEGAKFCDGFEVCDIRKPDEVEKIALKWNKRVGIDGVIAPAVEVAPSVGRIVDKLGLKGIGEREATVLTDKVKRREFFDSINITQPKWTRNNWIYNTYPCVIKPRDQAGAVGVRLINSSSELCEAGDYDLIEEFLEGHELSTEVLCFQQGTCLSATADRNYDKKLNWKPALIEDGCSFPSKISPKILTRIDNIIQKIVKELKLSNCALKLDLLVRDNQIFVIEAAPRLGGGKLSSHMISGVAGYDHWGVALRLAMGIQINELPKAEIKGTHCVQRYRFPPEGVKNHKERIGSVEEFGQSYEEALNKVNETLRTIS